MCCLLFVAAAIAGDEGPCDAEERKAFAWFKGLGYADVTKLPFVRLGTGVPHLGTRAGDLGFLVRQSEREFTVFTVGLRLLTIQKGMDGPLEERGGLERADFIKFVRGGLTAHRKRFDGGPFGHARVVPPLHFRLFVLAYACAGREHFQLAHALWELARNEKPDCEDFLGYMKTQVRNEALRNVRLQFGDTSKSFRDLLEAHRLWKKRFGGGVDNDIATLERIAKDAKSRKEQGGVGELIYRLKDSVHGEWLPKDKRAAARQLVNLGHEAVPLLILAFDDDRFSRSLAWGYSDNGLYRDHFQVSRVGSITQSILEEIAAREFLKKTEAEAWWQQFQIKGEKRALMDGVARGDDNACSQALRLIDKYPEAALEPLLTGIGNARAFDRVGLVTQLAGIQREEATQFLLREINPGRGTDARVAAAWHLLTRHRADGVTAMIDLWAKDRSRVVLEFLASCGRPEAVRALKEGFYRRGNTVAILKALEWRRQPWYLDGEKPKVAAGYFDAVEEVLVGGLADSTRIYMLCEGPRVCDLAASVLARRFKDRYHYDHEGALDELDRRLTHVKNVWRKKRSLRPLPIPELRRVKPLPKDVAETLRDRILGARDNAARAAAISDVEQVGLPALSAVLGWVEELDAKHLAREELYRLAQRLACRVVNVEISPDSVGPGRELYKLLDEARGRPLQRERLAAILAEAARDMPKSAEGIELAFYRETNGTGIVLSVRLPPKSNRIGKSWRASMLSHPTRHSSWSWSGECTLVAASRPGYWTPVLDKLQDFLNTAPYTTIDGRVSLLVEPK